MKTNKFFNIAAGIALALGATACSSDYLDLEPEGTLDYESVLTNTEGATLAVHGIMQSMYKQYSALYDYYWFNGEPWLSMYYGEVMGQDYISLFWFLFDSKTVDWSYMDRQSNGAVVAWTYCYNIIAQANNLLTYTPKKMNANGEVMRDENGNPIPDIEGEYAFRYAQALTMRAHAYSRLMQIYAPRWEDRFKDGEEILTVPLRLQFVEPEGNLDCPLSPMSVVMDQIYADLNQALTLYDESGMNRQYNWEPDKQITQGIFARAALLKNDYKTAQAMAHEARQGYPLMQMDEYLEGFATPNSEWMWTNSGEAQGLYYASFGATYACNGAYPCLWGNIGAGAIDNDLLELPEDNDKRAWLYYGPRNALAHKSDFWNNSNCDSRTMNINSGSSGLHGDFLAFAETRYKNVADNGWYPPYTYQGYPMSSSTTVCTAQFGAQFKFWGTDGYSTSFFPFMRSAEMYLIEAEAAWQNGDNATALSLLNEINSNRIEKYRPKNPSGDELLAQIKLCRRIELWGEGFNWFDFKRWKTPIVRRAWERGVTGSGNWPSQVAGTHDPSENRGWRWRIPQTEFDYNHAISAEEAYGD